jgi:membrane associated rhomboid family serine protease
MFPISDDNPHHGRPVMTWVFIAACVLVFLWQMSLGDRALHMAILALGVAPSTLVGDAQLPPDIFMVPPWATLFTSMFLHGGFMHLAGNMLYLWIFGDNVEVALGWKRFITFYLVCGLAAAGAQTLVNPQSDIPMIGASGAISGVLGAYLMLFPRATVRVLMFPFGIFGVPALIVLGVWFGMQLLNGFGSSGAGGGVAFWAHVGGFVAGMALIPLMKLPGVPLFARAQHKPFYREPVREAFQPTRSEVRSGQAGPWGRRDDDQKSTPSKSGNSPWNQPRGPRR